jgi:F-type H+-transporting ATPase subunit gamma
MANLKDLRVRINSVKSTQKITQAMKMVAASKLRRAQEAVEASRPYAERMETVLGSLASGVQGLPGAPKLLVGTGKDETYLLVVATSERGLCGGFNSSIVRAARRRAHALRQAGKTVRILCIGSKGQQQLKRDLGELIIDTVPLSGTRTASFEEAREIGRRVLAMYDHGEFDVALLFYNRFQSVMAQIVTEQKLIPASLPEGKERDLHLAVYDYEPDEESILADLLPRNVMVQLYRVMLENAASEQGARMTAMDNATRNAGDMIGRLTLQYNRTRQAVITTELIEIIAGAEAL